MRCHVPNPIGMERATFAVEDVLASGDDALPHAADLDAAWAAGITALVSGARRVNGPRAGRPRAGDRRGGDANAVTWRRWNPDVTPSPSPDEEGFVMHRGAARMGTLGPVAITRLGAAAPAAGSLRGDGAS